MIETHPVQKIERTLADEFAAVHRRVFAWPAVTAQVHFRDDTVVCLLDGDEDLPVPDPHLFPEIRAAVRDLVDRILGRNVVLPYTRTRLSRREVLVVIRLH